MQVHEFIEHLEGAQDTAHLDGWRLHAIFAGLGLLPESLNAELLRTDVETCALFAFCLWTQSDTRSAAYFSKALQLDGLRVWVDSQNAMRDAVEYIGEIFRDWNKAQAVDAITNDVTGFRLTFEGDGFRRVFLDSSDAFTRPSNIRTIYNNAQGDSSRPLLHLAAFFSGHASGQALNPDPRGTVRAVIKRGNFYKG